MGKRCLALALFLIFEAPVFSADPDDDLIELQKEFEAERRDQKRTRINSPDRKRRSRRASKVSAEVSQKKKRSRARWLFTGAGAVMPFLGEGAKDAQGTVSSFPPVTMVQFGISARKPVLYPWLIVSPFFSFTPLGSGDAEGGARSRVINFGLPVAYPIVSQSAFGIEPRIGPGLMLYSISGSGGTTVLENGTSTTTFYKPDQSSVASLLFLDVGVSIYFLKEKRIKLDFDAIFTEIFSKTGRGASTYSAMLSYGVL